MDAGMKHGPWSMEHEPWSMDLGMNNGPWTMVHGPWSMAMAKAKSKLGKMQRNTKTNRNQQIIFSIKLFFYDQKASLRDLQQNRLGTNSNGHVGIDFFFLVQLFYDALSISDQSFGQIVCQKLVLNYRQLITCWPLASRWPMVAECFAIGWAKARHWSIAGQWLATRQTLDKHRPMAGKPLAKSWPTDGLRLANSQSHGLPVMCQALANGQN